MKRDPFSEKKKFMSVGDARLAYYEEGKGARMSVFFFHLAQDDFTAFASLSLSGS